MVDFLFLLKKNLKYVYLIYIKKNIFFLNKKCLKLRYEKIYEI